MTNKSLRRDDEHRETIAGIRRGLADVAADRFKTRKQFEIDFAKRQQSRKRRPSR